MSLVTKAFQKNKEFEGEEEDNEGEKQSFFILSSSIDIHRRSWDFLLFTDQLVPDVTQSVRATWRHEKFSLIQHFFSCVTEERKPVLWKNLVND